MTDINELLSLADPLTREITDSLISHNEEDDSLDYKTTVELSSNKEWLELTKDISAFANTNGGYLIFGISGQNNDIVGVTREVANYLKDSNNIQSKINRNVEPPILTLRSKEFKIDNQNIIVLLVPQSKGITHLISKDGAFTYPSGDKKNILKKGTFYVRRSAGNHLSDSIDLNGVVERRIDQFRESLINKVAMVVNSPENSNVYILNKDPSVKADERFIIEATSDAVPVKGMSFTVAPDGNEEEIAAWSVLYRGNPDLRPPPAEVWKWYSRRNKISLSKQHKLTLFKFSLWDNVPAFYWIQGLKVRDIKEALMEAIRGRPLSVDARQMLVIAAFLGKTHYANAIKALGSYKERIAPAMKTFPTQEPNAIFGAFTKTRAQTAAQLKSEKTRELNDIADTAREKEKEPGAVKRMLAQKIDCFIYAQTDQYK